jgi:hypothetical protein
MEKEINILTEDALAAAVAGDWDSAISLNKSILTKAPDTLSAHLRLGFAYLQKSEWTEAKKAYHKALNIQPLNQIARNNLDKIKILEKQNTKVVNKGTSFDPNLFINIFGKTKVVELLNVGQAHVLVNLVIGQKVDIKVKKRRIEVRTEDNEYIGAFPDDISKRLIYFLEEMSEYSVYIKDTTKQSVSVFIREDKKGKNVEKYTSFPKNIQDDLKMMHADEEDIHEEKDPEHEEGEEPVEEESEHSPFDIESLAEKNDDTEYFSEVQEQEDDTDEYEE